MLNNHDEILRLLPFLETAPSKLIKSIQQNAVLKNVSAGTMLAYEGDSCHNFFIVIAGNIRVYKPGPLDREVTLYHIRENESCVITAFCVLSKIPFPAYGIVESDTSLLIIPAEFIRNWANRFEEWRVHLYESLSLRINNILQSYDDVLFQPLEKRILTFLLSHTSINTPLLKITQQKLAGEIGASRVAVSRTLNKLMKRNLIQLERGLIRILDRPKLSQLKKHSRIYPLR